MFNEDIGDMKIWKDMQKIMYQKPKKIELHKK